MYCVLLFLQFFHFEFHDAGWHAICKANGELHIGQDSFVFFKSILLSAIIHQATGADLAELAVFGLH